MAKSKSQSAVTDAQIKKAAGEFSRSKQDLEDTRMEHASLCKNLDDRGIHRPALKLVHKLDKMDLAKAQDFMRSFGRYANVLGLTAKLAAQPDLIEDEDEGVQGDPDPDSAPPAPATPDYSPEAVH